MAKRNCDALKNSNWEMRGRTKEKSEGLKGKNDSKVFMFSRGGVCLFLRENQITARIAKINNEQSTY